MSTLGPKETAYLIGLRDFVTIEGNPDPANSDSLAVPLHIALERLATADNFPTDRVEALGRGTSEELREMVEGNPGPNGYEQDVVAKAVLSAAAAILYPKS